MGDLSKLRIALAQVEVVNGRPGRTDDAIHHMAVAAVEGGADVLVAANSLVDPRGVSLIGLNDARVDVCGDVAVIDACGERYRVCIGGWRGDCDFSVIADVAPYTLLAPESSSLENAVVVRPVGMRDEGRAVYAYDGGSAVYGRDGVCLARLCDDFEPDMRVVSFGSSAEASESGSGKLLEALVSTIRRFDDLVLGGNLKWIIGLSGGLDSSVVAGLLSLAIGSERVVGYNMATRYNSAVTRGNAADLAAAMGIELRGGSIEGMVVSLGNTLVEYGYPTDALQGLTLENAQARARGNLLSTFAAVEGGVVVNNGNRVECSIGYATLYGDSIGALAPIADLTKVQICNLARAINDAFGCEAVPVNLLPVETDEGYEWETMPSAELASGQRDPMKWFYHDWLVSHLLGDAHVGPVSLDEAACDIMEHYLKNQLADTEAAKWVRFYGLDDPAQFADDLEWMLRGIRKSTFKRLQAPPFIALAKSARDYGSCIAESQVVSEPSARFQSLLAELHGL